jgi:hypothetical protein
LRGFARECAPELLAAIGAIAAVIRVAREEFPAILKEDNQLPFRRFNLRTQGYRCLISLMKTSQVLKMEDRLVVDCPDKYHEQRIAMD